jgi:hypothetical protein
MVTIEHFVRAATLTITKTFYSHTDYFSKVNPCKVTIIQVFHQKNIFSKYATTVSKETEPFVPFFKYISNTTHEWRIIR